MSPSVEGQDLVIDDAQAPSGMSEQAAVALAAGAEIARLASEVHALRSEKYASEQCDVKGEPEALPRMPSQVKILGRTYSVGTSAKPLPDNWEDSPDDADGRTNNHKLAIWIYEGLSRGMQQETLVHEILHTCISFCTPGIRNVIIGRDKSDVWAFDFEEWFVEVLDAPLLTVMRENPDLMDYLLS